MGQKVSPIGLRIGINKTWESNWYADNKDFAKFLNNDVKIRRFLTKKLKDAAVSCIMIERTAKKTDVIIHTAKPGVVIGHGGDEIEKLKKELSKLVNEDVQISIMEVKNPDVVAALVAENIAHQIETPLNLSYLTWNLARAQSLWGCVRLFVTPWIVAHQAPLSMGFSRQEWSG